VSIGEGKCDDVFCMDALETEQIRVNRISISVRRKRKKETFKLNWGLILWKRVIWEWKKVGGLSSIPKKRQIILAIT